MTQDQAERPTPPETWKGHRACFECRRKKTRCDMRKPNCGLCTRTGQSCTFPTKRKTPQRRRQESQIDSQKLERLVNLLESRLSDGQDIDMLLSQTEQLPKVNDIHTPNSLDREQDQPMRDDSNDESQSEIIVFGTSITAEDSTSPASTFRSTEADVPTWLGIPVPVLTDLVHIFFSKTQGWLPLLHKPRFFARFMKNGVFDDRKHSNTEALLLCGMFALAARHSSNPWFHSIPAPDRGQAFMEKANSYYEKCQSDQAPSLEYLQGCILLAAYEYASGPSHRAWILAGVCVRLAYDLNLCSMDEQDESSDWSILEEQRHLKASLMRRDKDNSFEQRFALFFPSRVPNNRKDDQPTMGEGLDVEELRSENISAESSSGDSELQQLLQPTELGDAETLMTELATLAGRGLPRYVPGDTQPDWNSGISLNFLDDDHQHLNYLQL
ncbi:hypothetical protein HZS61_006708 [Fusarium oxysporum f. sp. conglutinans]|uniref:Zn(2)-C6 fungal-type domain-containing protein n=1 Tax=Fusarium oxysporum f. sp. conglutinans TaxID=100902 RepID=A0A8H6G8K8_FUSOX|nr:hypothetical protein HZS61_006708 [Fusarium oxysporum f. sp. conglutinans]